MVEKSTQKQVRCDKFNNLQKVERLIPWLPIDRSLLKLTPQHYTKISEQRQLKLRQTNDDNPSKLSYGGISSQLMQQLYATELIGLSIDEVLQFCTIEGLFNTQPLHKRGRRRGDYLRSLSNFNGLTEANIHKMEFMLRFIKCGAVFASKCLIDQAAKNDILNFNFRKFKITIVDIRRLIELLFEVGRGKFTLFGQEHSELAVDYLPTPKSQPCYAMSVETHLFIKMLFEMSPQSYYHACLTIDNSWNNEWWPKVMVQAKQLLGYQPQAVKYYLAATIAAPIRKRRYRTSDSIEPSGNSTHSRIQEQPNALNQLHKEVGQNLIESEEGHIFNSDSEESNPKAKPTDEQRLQFNGYAEKVSQTILELQRRQSIQKQNRKKIKKYKKKNSYNKVNIFRKFDLKFIRDLASTQLM